jgi:hypothetical protein
LLISSKASQEKSELTVSYIHKVSTCLYRLENSDLRATPGRAPIDYIIFTSISTPDGSESDVNASINFGTGLMISIKRLCTRISNCSRASLWTNVERLTVYFRISLGSGTGPRMVASCRFAVSIICLLMHLTLCFHTHERESAESLHLIFLSVVVISGNNLRQLIGKMS